MRGQVPVNHHWVGRSAIRHTRSCRYTAPFIEPDNDNPGGRCRFLRRIVVLTGLMLLSMLALRVSEAQGTALDQLSAIPIPPGARIQSIGENVEHNGQLMSLASFSSPQPMTDTVAFYREQWSREDPLTQNRRSRPPSLQQSDAASSPIPPVVENRVGPWLILGRLHGAYQHVLQLNLDSPQKSEGYLSVMRLSAAATKPIDELALPGLELLSSTRSSDWSRTGSISIYRTSDDVESVQHQLAQLWQRRGWELLSNRTESRHRVHILNRRDAQLDVVISPDEDSGGSLVVVNEVRLDDE